VGGGLRRAQGRGAAPLKGCRKGRVWRQRRAGQNWGAWGLWAAGSGSVRWQGAVAIGRVALCGRGKMVTGLPLGKRVLLFANKHSPPMGGKGGNQRVARLGGMVAR
ncbi:MAG: hypothetical protein ABF544_09130, partial [Acetobacter orientalis]|uniref:hypothetical protein n=1 Tax=Acetobacter orientalis TaxID=146474 RepID=UPI0039E8F7EB